MSKDRQTVYEADDENLFSKIKTIIQNKGVIVQVVSLNDRHLIIYTNHWHI